ncbi:MAG: DNA-3-methyladenine glycosylase I [Gammaproteobacteria bacterium CG_4_10_14_0_8_um_filter_38_16]|nr:MAG: DNA-3-methyladenine glycosylase I [Gammaproteobacteria bacterium CG_4_10_14_0_8_um_filter_38_16]PJA03191.1 MAG: DNA-3-methyladenine glycosylase I [Gammaproteobacteria bacterium CG_4_10_14_0_2_um_filter_38_22]PJB10518.1 MAG: DNA-3-methyladenine glycosylase I [Gammaproteobacteria bacterium CG_4_9_14_3_um_filter_38_9]
MLKSTSVSRCAWVTDDPLYIAYHDREWGVPVYDDRLLFELLTLEGAQAGLSWITILKRREHYRLAFDHFDIEKIAKYDDKKYQAILNNSGVIRHRLKIQSVITNAQAYLNLKEEFPSFSDYLWGFVDHMPIQNKRSARNPVPANTPISDAMSRDLKKRGFKFVGSTICYAFMQAVGMVNDHLTTCFCFEKINKRTSNAKN